MATATDYAQAILLEKEIIGYKKQYENIANKMQQAGTTGNRMPAAYRTQLTDLASYATKAREKLRSLGYPFTEWANYLQNSDSALGTMFMGQKMNDAADFIKNGLYEARPGEIRYDPVEVKSPGAVSGILASLTIPGAEGATIGDYVSRVGQNEQGVISNLYSATESISTGIRNVSSLASSLAVQYLPWIFAGFFFISVLGVGAKVKLGPMQVKGGNS